MSKHLTLTVVSFYAAIFNGKKIREFINDEVVISWIWSWSRIEEERGKRNGNRGQTID